MNRALVRSAAVLAFIFVLAGPAGASAPDSLGLRVGDRVRIGDRYGRYVYVVRDVRVDSLLVDRAGPGGERAMSIDEASSIEIGTMNARSTGALGGTCLGVVLTAAACTAVMDGQSLREDGSAIMAAGGVLGGLIGVVRPGTRWKQIYWGGPTREASAAYREPLMFDSTGADVVVRRSGLRAHVNIGIFAGYDKENAPSYERSRFRYLNELGLKFMHPIGEIERLESVAIAYTLSIGEASYETRHSVGPTAAFRLNDRWTASLMAGPLWFHSTHDFKTGVQCRGYFVYRNVVSCEALLYAAPPSAGYRAGGGEWQTSLYTGVGLHGRPAGGVLLGEVIVGAAWVLAVVIMLSTLQWDG